jgi:hypothetical protein
MLASFVQLVAVLEEEAGLCKAVEGEPLAGILGLAQFETLFACARCCL